mmetsp:Transcript_2337/g.5375  ORF Transcript_2337/g.5375 Transcript_2337/m.5375 type:complete len:120 (-) Transcript_2337:641-1000(-)
MAVPVSDSGEDTQVRHVAAEIGPEEDRAAVDTVDTAVAGGMVPGAVGAGSDSDTLDNADGVPESAEGVENAVAAYRNRNGRRSVQQQLRRQLQQHAEEAVVERPPLPYAPPPLGRPSSS